MSGKRDKSDGIRSSGSRVLRKARSFKDELKTKIIRRTPSSLGSGSPSPLSPISQGLPPLNLTSVKDKSPKARRRGLSRGISFNEGSSSEKHGNKKESDIEKLENQGKKVLQDLRYIEDVVKKKILQLLPGSTTVVLETLMEFYQSINSYDLQSDSTAVESRSNRVCVSMADLVRWSDHILLNGLEALNEEEARTVIQNFKDSLQELIEVVIERISKKAAVRNCQSFPAKPSSVSQRASVAEDNTLPEIPLTPRELKILEETNRMSGMYATPGLSRSMDDVLDHLDAEVHLEPPPKPPLPPAWEHSRLGHSSDLDIPVPPPLPEKRRMTTSQDSSSSVFSDRSTPTVQSPLIPVDTSPQSEPASRRWSRTTSQSTDSYLDRSDVSPHATPLNQSPTSSVSSVFSASSEDLLERSNRNHFAITSPVKTVCKSSMESCSQSMTSSTSVASQNIQVMTSKIQNLTINVTQKRSSTGSSSGSDCGPPPLPDKHQPGPPKRVNSQYDNMPEDGVDLPDLSAPDKVVLRRHHQRLSDEMDRKRSGILLDNLFSGGPSESDLSSGDPQGPPPLPPKKKMVQAYMHMFGQYQSPKEEFRHSIHSLNFYQSQWHQYQMELLYPTRSNTVSFVSSASSGRSSDVYSVASGSSGEEGQGALPFDHLEIHQPPPSLPPKENSDKKKPLPIEVKPVMPQHDKSEISVMSADEVVKNCVMEGEYKEDYKYEEDNEEEEESGVQDITGESNSSDPQSNRTSTGSSIRPSSPPLDGHKDGDSDFSESCLLDEVDVSDQLVRKNPDEDGPEIRGGSVDALVVYGTTLNKHDFMYQEAFLTTYRTFIAPRELIDKLLYRYSRFSKIDDVKKKKLSRNAFSFLVRVVDELCMEVDDDVLQNLMNLEYQLLCDAELTLAKLLRKKTLEKAEQRRQVQLASQQTTLLSAYQLTAKQCRLIDFKSEHVAEQMTMLDAELFLKIEIPEVLLWAKEQNEEHSPNLAKFTEHFNKMSYWCRTRILEQDDPREREHYLNKFIRIMRHLRKLNNFNSYLAILSAVDSAPIRRLEWQKQNSDALREFCQLIDSSSSFRAYRQALAETEPPCIPYIGLILQDLTFVHIGNQDFLPNGEVNFAKRWQQFNILDNMKRFKKCDYDLKKNQKILTYFDNFSNYLCEESLWQISETIKPRGTRR